MGSGLGLGLAGSGLGVWVRVGVGVGLALGLDSGRKVRVRVRVRGYHGRGREAGRRPRRTDVAPGATEAALVGGVARPLQADHEAGAKGSQVSFELGGGRCGRHIAERGEEEEHRCTVIEVSAWHRVERGHV